MVRHTQACTTLSKITNYKCLWKRLIYFIYLMHVVTHPGKLWCCHIVFVWYGPVCSKFLWNNQSLVSLKRVVWICWFFTCSCLHLVGNPLKLPKFTILGWYCQAYIVRLVLSGWYSQLTRVSGALKLKKLKTIRGVKLIFSFYWS